MPYSQPFDPATPDGSTTPAAAIDTEFQNLKAAIIERMNDTLFEDFEDDPLVLKNTVIGQVDGLELWIPAADMVPCVAAFAGGFDYHNFTTGYAQFADEWVVPVKLPVGVEITDIKLFAKISSGADVVATLRFLNTAGTDGVYDPTAVTITCSPNANGLFNLYVATGLSYSVVSGWHQIHIQCEADDKIAGVMLIYNSSSHLVRR